MSACLCCSVSVLTAQSVSQCVCHGEASGQLEWVLLDAHFALLQRIIQQAERQSKAATEKQFLVAKRCQALTALICLTSISPCQELLDMQERVRVISREACIIFVFALIFPFCKVDNECVILPYITAGVLGCCTVKH